MEIYKYIEHTNIDPRAKKVDIKILCTEAKLYKFRSVCVNPEWSHLCKLELAGTNIKIVTVFNFPTSKSRETKYSDEIDVLIQGRNCLTPKGNKDVVRQLKEVQKLRSTTGKPVKVVIETHLLTKKEIMFLAGMVAKYKLDYIKTSTGLYNRLYEQFYIQAKTNQDKNKITKMLSRDNFEDLELIKKGFKLWGIIPRQLLHLYVPKIKISGGIKSYIESKKLVNNGADLLGMSGGVQVVIQSRNTK